MWNKNANFRRLQLKIIGEFVIENQENDDGTTFGNTNNVILVM